jgi:LPS export ABC transporter protein LptC
MRAMLRAVPALVVAASLAGACGGGAGQTTAGVNEASILDSADQVAFGFRTLVTDAGLLRAEVFADTALFLDQNTRASLRNVQGDFFGATGAKEATLTARLGNLNTRSNELEAWGNVIITSVDGRVLKTPMIRYVQSQNVVLSDSAFVLTEPGEKEMRGIGFRTDPSLNAIQVLQVDRTRGGAVRMPDD